MTAVDPDRQIRPFADFLQEMAAGDTHSELSVALNELVTAVTVTGKVGTLTLTIKVKPAGRNSEATVLITDDVKVKVPVGDRPESVFFVDTSGNVVRHNPNQGRLPLREVPGGIAVDLTTGEIKEAN